MDAVTEYFRGFVEVYPEESTFLGLSEGSDRLRLLDDAGLDAMRALHVRAISRLHEIEDRGDRWAVESRARTHLHMLDTRAHEHALELSLYPHTVMQHQRAHDDAIDARAAAVPRFLAEQEALLARGAARCDRAVVAHFVERQLPLVAASFDALGHRAAADAYRAQRAFYETVLLPQAGEPKLGDDEVRFRLRTAYAIDDDPNDLIDDAEQILAAAQNAMRAHARTATFEEASEKLTLALQRRPTAEAIFDLYRAHTERARSFVSARGMFNVPPEAEVRFRETPASLAEVVGASNWPAPLLDQTKRAHFVVSPDPARHAIVQSALLSVHEGIPGHALQSMWWQRRFGRSAAPVRFLLVADDACAAHDTWGTMPNIEGFAAYVEERMREVGYYEEDEALFAISVRGFRALRVIVDLGLQLGTLSPDAAAARLSKDGCVSLDFARREVLRYRRIPLQAMTYMVGARQIERMRDARRLALGARWREATFHDELFSYGPLPPEIIQDLQRTAS